MEKCQFCPWSKEIGKLWKLDKVPFTGLKGAGEIYTESEAKQIGLEGLTEGVDYTKTIQDGGDQYVVIMEPVKDKSVGSRQVELNKCNHLEFVWGGNEQFHWEICTNCSHLSAPEAHAYEAKVVTAATCTQDAVIVMKCKCGRVDPNGRTAPTEGDPAEWFAHHVWGTQYESDFYDHWVTCTVCGVAGDKQAHELTNITVLVQNDCITNGSIQADCAVCGKKGLTLSAGIDSEVEKFPVLNDYKALGHDFTGPVTWFTGPRVCTEEGQGTHAATCTRCHIHDDANKQPHAWTGLHTEQNGTCGDPNDPVIQEASCECGATLHIEKIREHVPVEDKSKDVQATCTESGKINGHRCLICGTFYDYEFVEALGHEWVVDEKAEATCLADGFIKSHCDRCKEQKTEILKMKSPDGKHHYVPQISKQPTCTEKGTANGEKCKYCDAEQAGNTGYGEIPALGHLKKAETTKKGRVREFVNNDGVNEVTCFEVLFYCERCSHGLGVEYYTVGTNPKISRYLIEPGRDVKITDLGNGIHIDGNMANDGGVYFNGEVQNAFNEVIDLAAKKYTYKKVPANSFIIEFTDEFLAEQEDGDYTLEVINGSEYWPLVVTIKDHKFVDVQPMDVPQDVPEWSTADYEAWVNQIKEAGGELKELSVGCPDRKKEHDGVLTVKINLP